MAEVLSVDFGGDVLLARACAGCGGPIRAEGSLPNQMKQRYCSETCARRVQERNRRQRRRGAAPVHYHTFPCWDQHREKH